jgi:short-subunit dehydrogenase
MRLEKKVALITGASSGIGAALARAFASDAQRRNESLSLWLGARGSERLEAVASALRSDRCRVDAHSVDVASEAEMRPWIERCDRAKPLDVVIANAGISAGAGAGFESLEQAHRIVDTNVRGVINTVVPAAELMRRRGRGRIVIVSSLSARLPLPATPTYSASKSFVRLWGRALGIDLARTGVRLTVVSPGYVATPMSAHNNYWMPFTISPDAVAAAIIRVLPRAPRELALPWRMAVTIGLIASLPAVLAEPVLRRLPRKAPLQSDAEPGTAANENRAAASE